MLRYFPLFLSALITFISVHSEESKNPVGAIDLESLLAIELHLVDHLENYLKKKEEQIKDIYTFLDKVDEVIEDAAEDPDKFFDNPFTLLQTVKRFAFDWKNIHESILSPAEMAEFTQELAELESPLKLPTHGELQTAVKGLSLLQTTYNLKTLDLANGKLFDAEYSRPLTATECFVMGRSLYEANEMHYAVEWFIEARKRLDNQVTDEEIKQYMRSAEFYSGNAKKSPEEATLNRNSNVPLNQRSRDEVLDLYKKTCSLELVRTPAELRGLRCRYVTNRIPFCRIAPFKMEELNLDPLVVVYHEAIYESEIEEIISATQANLTRSLVVNLASSVQSDFRTSTNTWLAYKQNAILHPLARRVEDITGLSLETAEALQVAKYGVGGHYGPHYDFFEISDVELGGATAFPFLRLAVPATRRSALLWYNLYESTEFDYRSKHAGCPVLKGSKWISTQWFSERGQEFLRPCNVKQHGHKADKKNDKVRIKKAGK